MPHPLTVKPTKSNKTFPTNSPPAPSLVKRLSLDFPFSISKQTACQVKPHPQNHIPHPQQLSNSWKLNKKCWAGKGYVAKTSSKVTLLAKLTCYPRLGKKVQIIFFKTVGLGYVYGYVASSQQGFSPANVCFLVEALIFKLLFILFL